MCDNDDVADCQSSIVDDVPSEVRVESQVELPIDSDTSPANITLFNEGLHREVCVPPWPALAQSLGSGRYDPFVKYPVHMTSRARMLLDHRQWPSSTYSVRTTLTNHHAVLDTRVKSLRSFRIAWYPVACIDEGCFNQVLSIAALSLGQLQQETQVLDTDAIRYHAAALSSVNVRLGDPNTGNTDGVIAAVTGFACHSRQVGEEDSWDLHMRGLETILQTRGGVKSVNGNTHLRRLLFL